MCHSQHKWLLVSSSLAAALQAALLSKQQEDRSRLKEVAKR
jgi:hypothetical protein